MTAFTFLLENKSRRKRNSLLCAEMGKYMLPRCLQFQQHSSDSTCTQLSREGEGYYAAFLDFYSVKALE